ncbi:MAG: hypothetical protein GXO22_04340 [Aquificae bacterium]|nr:hypothetical protein [Aquificota bacterium]
MFKIVKIKAPVKDYEVHFPQGNLVFLNNTTVDVEIAFDNPAQQKIKLRNKEYIRTDFNFLYISSSQTGDIELIVADKEFKLGSDFQSNIGTVNTINSVSQVVNVQNVDNVANVERTNSISLREISVSDTETELISSNPSRKRLLIKNIGSNLIYVSTVSSSNSIKLNTGDTLELKHYTGGLTFYCDSGLTSQISVIEEGV